MHQASRGVYGVLGGIGGGLFGGLIGFFLWQAHESTLWLWLCPVIGLAVFGIWGFAHPKSLAFVLQTAWAAVGHGSRRTGPGHILNMLDPDD
jgi:hypothetical protein